MILTPAGALACGRQRPRPRARGAARGPAPHAPRRRSTPVPATRTPAASGRAHGLARSGSVSTYRYAVHPTARLRGSPVLLVSPLGACGVAFDLRRGNSLVEHLVGEGRSVHQVDDEDLVGYGGAIAPGPADLERWVDEILPHVVRTVSRAPRRRPGAPRRLVDRRAARRCSAPPGTRTSRSPRSRRSRRRSRWTRCRRWSGRGRWRWPPAGRCWRRCRRSSAIMPLPRLMQRPRPRLARRAPDRAADDDRASRRPRLPRPARGGRRPAGDHRRAGPLRRQLLPRDGRPGRPRASAASPSDTG